MNIYALLSFAAFMVCFFLGNFIYHKNPRSQLNILIAFLSIFTGFLAFIEFEYRLAETVQAAFFWLKISTLWPLIPSLLLHISLVFTKSGYLKNKLIYILIYLPSIIIITLSLTTNLLLDHALKEYWGWTYAFPAYMALFNIMTLWTVSTVVLAGFICFSFYLNSQSLKRKQAKYMLAGLYMPLLISFSTDFILPNVSLRVPEMTMTMMSLGIGLISYGIWKYRFPALTTTVVSDKIISTMSNFLFLLNSEENIINVNKASRNLLGYDDSELIGKPVEIIFPGKKEKKAIFNGLLGKKILENKETCFKAKDGTTITVLLSISLIQSEDNETVGIVCIGSDITDMVSAKNEIKNSLQEKELLLREVHHRVKNNLQIISSLLNLQSGYIKNKDDLEIFKDSLSRVKSMAFVHEQLYQSSNLANVEFSEYVRNLLTYLLHYYTQDPGSIKLNINVENVFMDIDTSIPCGLIVNELVTNSLKHAFHGKPGEISIDLHSINDDQYMLTVADNGTGLPEGFDFKNTETLGLQLVNGLVNQLDGTIELDSSNGTRFKIIINKLEYAERI